MFVKVKLNKRHGLIYYPSNYLQDFTLSNDKGDNKLESKGVKEQEVLRVEYDNLQSKLQQLLLEIQQLRNLKDDCSSNLKNIQNENLLLNGQITSKANEQLLLKENYNSLTALHQQCIQRIQDLKKEKDNLEKTYTGQQQQNLKQAQDSIQTKINEYEKILKNAKDQLDDSLSKYATYKSNIDDEIKLLQEKIQLLNKQTTELTLVNSKCKQNQDELQKQILSLQQELLSPKNENLTTQKIQDDNQFKLKFILSQQSIYNKLLQHEIDPENTSLLEQEWLLFINKYNDIYLSTPTTDTTEQVYNTMLLLKTTLMNLFEDLSGSVRVYIRIKPQSGGDGVLSIDPGNLVASKCSLQSSKFGPFFGIIPPTFTNKDMYTGCAGTKIDEKTFEITSHQVEDEQDQKCCILSDTAGFCRVVEQLKNNYHVLLFSYGHSGSGKTYSLFGNKSDPGLLQLSISNSGATHFMISNIYELTMGEIDFRAGLRKNNFSTLINHKFPTGKNIINSKNIEIITSLLNNINNTREIDQRIVATPNNNQSSRSHLFMSISLFYPNSTVGKLTICDLGGRESPIDLLEMFYDIPPNKDIDFSSFFMDTKLPPFPRHNFTINDQSIQWYQGKDKQVFVDKLNKVDIKLLIKQSVFINETLNHLEYFVKNKQNLPFKYTRIKEDATFYKSQLGITKRTYNPNHFLSIKPKIDSEIFTTKNKTTSESDPFIMYSILTMLQKNNSNSNGNSNGNDSIKNKIVMICNIRQEEKYCTSIQNTLEFADNIKST